MLIFHRSNTIYAFKVFGPSVLEAMRSKYRIAKEKYDEFFWKLVRPKLVDFLNDERKRDQKKITVITPLSPLNSSGNAQHQSQVSDDNTQ